MNNQDRRKIVNQAKADGYQGSYVDLFKQAAQDPAMVANTPEQKQAGLRPFHEQGKTDASMAFPDTPPNTPFNTVGMKAPIDIKKFDEQGHLVKSYDAVPPGLTNIDSGPNTGTVLETPSRMQEGGYNMARAQELGYKPDATGHYPSVDHETGMLLKSKEHPTVKLEFMSQMLSPERKMIANPTGHFGDDQLQYVPRKKQQDGGSASDNTRVSMPKLQDQEAFNPYSDLHLPPSGRVEYSGANVEDLLGIGSLLKAPVKAAAKNTKAALKNTYKINPFANKLNNPNAHYRVVHGRAALDDALQSGVIRSGSKGGTPGYNLPKGFDDIRRTGFPSFSKGSPVIHYGKGKSSQTVFENSKGIFAKAGQPNPVTGKIIKSRHGAAHRPIDPKTGNVLSEIPVEKIFDANNPHWLKGFRQIKQTGGYNPGEYMNKMEPKVFPNQQRDAQWVKYAEDHDFAGRFPGETRTNEQIGLQRSNRNTVPLPPNPVGAKELRIKAQEGAFNIDPRLQNRIEAPQPQRTFLKPDNRSDRERAAADERFKADRKREEAIERGVNPNTAFMTPPGLGADNEARAAYEYDNPATSNIGQIAGGIGFLPIDRGLDVAMTAAGASIRRGLETRRYKRFKSEVDWGAWNPDTPNHPSLMEEYKNIEYSTKRAGTWMKNADGSPYKGSAEQFIQENSSHFKKAFPDGANRLYRGVAASQPLESDIGGGAVFTADENLARNYTGLPSPENTGTLSTANKYDAPLVRPGTPGANVDNTGLYRGAMSLLQPKSKNKYSIISEGDFWASVEIGGKSKDWLAKQAKFQRETVIPQMRAKQKPGDTFNAANIAKANAKAERFEYWGKVFDKITHRKPSGAPDFEDALKAHPGLHTTQYERNPRLLTDHIGEVMVDKDVNYALMYGLDDGGWSKYVNIHNNRPGNYLKSRVGNVGFFNMGSSDIFKAAAPIGIGAGMMSQRKDGGYKKAQKGSVVDYLLPALEANNPTEFADTQASNQAKVVSKSEQDLSAEQQRVEDVRANVIPTAENLAQLNSDIKYSNNIFGAGDSQYRPHLSHFDKMKKAKTPEEYKALEKEAKKSYPELIEAIPENNIMVMNHGKYKADDELYCTPYGCYTYDKAGATDVPEYSGNYGFVGGTKNGKNPFQKISGDEAVPGDIGLMLEYSPVDYRDPSKGKALRPHHTTILSEKTDDPQVIKAYSAIDGQRLNFMEGLLKAEDKRDKEGNKHEGRWDYYRYIGQTPYMQRAVGNAKHNQKQADMVAQAMQQQAEVASQLPDRDLTNVETIGRRDAANIEGNDISQDIVNITTEIPEQRKSGKQKVEELSNAVQGKVETAKERRARIKAINKRTRQNIKNIRKG